MKPRYQPCPLKCAESKKCIPIRSVLPPAGQFRHRFRFFLASVLVLLLGLTWPAQAQLTPEQVAAVKGATALVVIRKDSFPIGTAFCISESGLFATSIHRGGAESRPLEIILDPAGNNEKRYPAKVVREFKKSRLVILQADLTQKVSALKLGDAAPLEEKQQLFAFRYAFDAGNSANIRMMEDKNTYPSIVVDERRVWSLVKRADEMLVVQFNRPLKHMNSGGPVLDQRGAVVGVLFSDNEDDKLYAIQTSALKHAISTPVIVVERPKVAFAQRFNPAEFVVTLEWLRPSIAPSTAVSIEIAQFGKSRQADAVKGDDGKYRVSIAPFLPKSGEVKTKPRMAERAENKVEYKVMAKAAGGEMLASEEGTLFINMPGPAESANPTLKSDLALDTRHEIKLPSPVYDVAAAEGGRVLILHLKEISKLAVFDVSEQKIRGYIKLPGNSIVFAGGMRHILVADPAENLIHRFSVQTLEKERTIYSAIEKIVGLVMGNASPDNALIITQHAYGGDLTMFDVNRMVPEAKSRGNGDLDARASADGRTFGFYRTDVSPDNFDVMTFKDSIISRFQARRDSGRLVPNADGTLIFSSKEGIFTPKGAQVLKVERAGSLLLPSYHPSYFFSIALGRNERERMTIMPRPVSIFLSGASDPFVKLPDAFEEMQGTGATPTGDTEGGMTLDKRFHFYPQMNLFLTIPKTDDKLVVRPVDVRKILKERGVDYLYVTTVNPPAKVSQPYQYQMEAVSKAGRVKFALQSGPKGLTISSAGLVKWTAPAKPTEERVIVVLKDSAKQEVLHTFRLVVVE